MEKLALGMLRWCTADAADRDPARCRCPSMGRRWRSPLDDDRASDDQTEQQRQQDWRYEPLPQIKPLGVGHVDRRVEAGAQALITGRCQARTVIKTPDSLSLAMSREIATMMPNPI